MTTVSDVVVLGAGILGASAAFHLAKTGKRVIVVEKSSIASGMTKRSGALVRAFFPDENMARLARHSLATYQDWKKIVGGECGYKQTGLLITSQGSARLEQLVARMNGVGVNVRLVTSNDIRDIEPNVRGDDLTHAAYEPDAGYIDPVLAAQSFVTRAKELGAKFQTGTLARSIRVERNRVMAVTTTVGEIQTLEVVMATGGWSARLLKPLGIELGIQNERHQVAFFDRPEELRSGHAAVWDATHGAYFRPHPYGLTMGGLIAEKVETGLPDQLDESVSDEFVTAVREKIAARLPALANAKFLRGHAGYYDTTPDGLPILGRIPGLHGLIIAAGFGNAGLCVAPAVGACIAELIYDGETRMVDLTKFRPDRF